MKHLLLTLAVVASLEGAAQEVQILSRGPHHQVVQRVSGWLDQNGKQQFSTNRFTELANGLCYLPEGPNAQWELTREEFQEFEQGFVANAGPMRVVLAANVNTANTIDVGTSDGKRFEISPLFIAMRDGAGRSVLVSEIQDSVGQLIAPNIVLYEQAFAGAAIRITYTREGIEQDCVIFDDTAFRPQEYGLDPESTRIELWSEFANAPAATVSSITEGTEASDVVVDFGSTKIASGIAFPTGDPRVSVPVRKAFGLVENRRFLVEKVNFTDVKPFLNQPNPKGANAGNKTSRASQTAKRQVVRSEKDLVAQSTVRSTTRRSASVGKRKNSGVGVVAYDWKKNPGFVIDFQLLNTTNLTGVTFQGDTTYHIAGTVTLSGTTTWEAGAVLKYTNGARVKITGPVSWLGSTWRPVVMTGIDDLSIGDTVRANALTGQYADTALDFDANTAGADMVLQNIRISHATNAIRILGRSGHALTHAQFVNCGTALSLTNATTTLRNALLYNVGTTFTGSNSTARCEHLTIDLATTLNGNASGLALVLTNSLLTAVTTTSGYSGASVTTLSSSAGVYQTVGAAAHYLADSSPYRDAGISTISTSLAADLKALTTFPPMVIAKTQLTAPVVTYSRIVQRDSDTPDLGYHYSPMDYAVNALWATNGTAIYVKPGVVIAGYGTASGNYIFWIDNGAKLKVEGTPALPCQLLWYNAVQEQANTNWAGYETALITRQTVFGTAPSTEISFRFAELGTMGTDLVNCFFGSGFDTNALPVVCRDTVFHGGAITVDLHLLSMTNCLFDRVSTILQGNPGDANARAYFRNNLLVGGAFETDSAGVNLVSIRDSIFYQSTLTTNSDVWDNGWNAYHTNGCTTCGVLNNPQVANIVTNITFQSGPLGRFYLPQTSLLIDKGSTNAPVVGFYHYTTATNQVKEASSALDIGWHYVATSSYSSILANDADGDGIPDALEDIDGDGAVDSGETDWNNATDLGLYVRITQPKVSANVP